MLGCVVLPNPDGTPAEIQAFTRVGVDGRAVEAAIEREAAAAGLGERLGQIFIFELEAESHLGDSESLARAAEVAEQEARSKGPLGVLHALGTLHSLAESGPEGSVGEARPPLISVLLSSSSDRTEAEVALGNGAGMVLGSASADRSPHGLAVVTEATLRAVSELTPGAEFSLVEAFVQDLVGRQAVVVLLREADGRELLGAVLVRDAPVSEAAVRATLDAINRRLSPAP